MSTLFRGLINNIRSDYVYMSPDGDDSNTGEVDSPVKSLKRALEIASVNGRGVFVKSGTYDLTQGFDSLDPSITNFYYSNFGGKPYQANMWGNKDLQKSAFYIKSPILGEFTLYREFSTGYTFAKVSDMASLSYTTIQVSPSPNFDVDELKGKILLINNDDSVGYSSPAYYYRIIKNTADTIYLTGTCGAVSSIRIYDCPTLRIPSGKNINFSSLGFSLIGLNFEVIGNFSIYGNTDLYSCHFFASTPKYIYHSEANNIIPNLRHCLFDSVYANGIYTQNALLYRCAFRGISPAIKNITNVTSCSAWECGDFYQLDSGTFIGKIRITCAGGQDNTGNFININTSGGYKSSNAEILLQGSTTTNAFPINIKDIQFANGYKISLDTIPYQLLARQQVVKLVENEDGLKIWISG